MEGYRRLITFIVTISALVAPIIGEYDITPNQILAITAVGMMTLLGYNGQDWIKATGLLRYISTILEGVANEMEKIEPPPDKPDRVS